MHISPLESCEYLFDLESDPGEINNLAGDHPEQLKELKELGEWDVSLPHPLFLEGAVWKKRQQLKHSSHWPWLL